MQTKPSLRLVTRRTDTNPNPPHLEEQRNLVDPFHPPIHRRTNHAPRLFPKNPRSQCRPPQTRPHPHRHRNPIRQNRGVNKHAGVPPVSNSPALRVPSTVCPSSLASSLVRPSTDGFSYPLSSSFPPAAWHRLVGNKEKGFVTPFFTHIQGKSLQVKGVANPFSIDASPLLSPAPPNPRNVPIGRRRNSDRLSIGHSWIHNSGPPFPEKTEIRFASRYDTTIGGWVVIPAAS